MNAIRRCILGDIFFSVPFAKKVLTFLFLLDISKAGPAPKKLESVPDLLTG